MKHRKTVATLSILTFNLFKILAEIYIKFNTARKSPTPLGVGLFLRMGIWRADSNGPGHPLLPLCGNSP
jgi:hypothetical protein